jgi:uncharacterized protein (TIGR02117 family)
MWPAFVSIATSCLRSLAPRVASLSLAAWLTLAVATGGCGARPGGLGPALDDATAISIAVIDHGWHTAIVVRRADVDRALWPAVDDFAAATFVEVAWGDRDFYMATSASAWLAIKAAVFGDGSVLHVVGFDMPIAVYFAGSDVIPLRVSRRGFDAMTRFVSAEYQMDAEGRPRRLQRGLYGTSWFYEARSGYHVFNTCNTWVARALREAGLPVTPAATITAAGVMQQLRGAPTAR